MPPYNVDRAVSSVGRAPALHAGCQGFESLTAQFIGSSRIGPSVIGIGTSRQSAHRTSRHRLIFSTRFEIQSEENEHYADAGAIFAVADGALH